MNHLIEAAVRFLIPSVHVGKWIIPQYKISVKGYRYQSNKKSVLGLSSDKIP